MVTERKLPIHQGPLYAELDVLALNVLPPGWDQRIRQAAQQHARHTHLPITWASREPSGSPGVDYWLMDGDAVVEHLPWLYALYTGVFLQACRQIGGTDIIPDPTPRSGIVVNLVQGQDARYEWHVDSNPLTGTLYVTTHGPNDGGELAFQIDGAITCVSPRAGRFLAWDARDVPHSVLPLRMETARISVPMNYYRQGEPARRWWDEQVQA